MYYNFSLPIRSKWDESIMLSFSGSCLISWTNVYNSGMPVSFFSLYFDRLKQHFQLKKHKNKLQGQIFRHDNTDHITAQQIKHTQRSNAIIPPPAAYI